jgi:F-type H+-transporting ATPase subunit b
MAGLSPGHEEALAVEALGIQWGNLIFQLIAFLILIWLLQRFAFGPAIRALDARAARVRGSMETAERIEREMAETQRRNQEILDEARREAQGITTSARQAGEEMLARAREEATAQRERELERARQQIRAETEQAKQELRREVADLAITAASRIVRQELDPAKHLQLIQQTLAEAGDGSGARPTA